MKCDRVLSSLATGNLVARWRARRHIGGCPRCALVRNQLLAIARELTDAPPLTASQRALWTSAGIEPVASRGRPVWAYGAGLLAASVAIAAVGLWLLPLGNDTGVPPLVVDTTPNPSPPDSAPPTERGPFADEVLAQVDRLERELNELRREGELIDVRNAADALWERYAPRKPPRF